MYKGLTNRAEAQVRARFAHGVTAPLTDMRATLTVTTITPAQAPTTNKSSKRQHRPI